MAEEQDIVLLIHGTGAARAEDEGEVWWQIGSHFCQVVNKDLSPQARCHEKGEIFHWSGKNSEQERRQAGKDLFDHLWKNLEQKKQPYHLISHSHGGGVIWHAFLQAIKEEKELRHLKSWSTAGTPFFQHRAKRFDLWLILPFIISLSALIYVIQNYLWLFLPGIKLGWEQVDKTASVVMLLHCFALGSIALYTGFLVVITSRTMFLLQHERKRSKEAASQYSHCWLNLYSLHDEAINGLRSNLNPSGQMIPRWVNKHKSLLPRILWTPIIFVYNMIAFFVDEFTWNKIKKGVQGTDILGFQLDKVDWPYRGEGEFVQIPPDIDAELIAWANENIKKIIGPIRENAGKFDITKAFSTIAGSFVGKEMVHSSYYQKESVIHILSQHVAKHIVSKKPEEHLAQTQVVTLSDFELKAKTNTFIFQVVCFFILFFSSIIFWQGAKLFYTTQLQSGILRGIHLKEVDLSGTNLRGAKLSRTDLAEAKLSRADLRGADLQEADMWEVDLSFAQLQGSNLSLAKLDGANFSEANLHQNDLSGATLREANLFKTDLSESCLNFANLHYANLRKANISKGYFWSTNLRESNLRESNLKEAKFFFADLSGADLREANLSGANLTGANLNGANLSGANLSGAILSKTTFQNTNLNQVNFYNVEGLTLEQVLQAKTRKGIQGLSPSLQAELKEKKETAKEKR